MSTPDATKEQELQAAIERLSKDIAQDRHFSLNGELKFPVNRDADTLIRAVRELREANRDLQQQNAELQRCYDFNQSALAKLGWHNKELTNQLAAAQKRIAELEEVHNMQLAGISTACVQNTESSKRDRIDRDNPYWTVAYGDTCVAVDREIRERTRAEQAESDLRAAREALETAYNDMASAKTLIEEGQPSDARDHLFAGYTRVEKFLVATEAAALSQSPASAEPNTEGDR